MTEEIEKKGSTYFRCQECGLLYAQRDMAEKCQAWCAEHQSCNLEITKYAFKDSSDS